MSKRKGAGKDGSDGTKPKGRKPTRRKDIVSAIAGDVDSDKARARFAKQARIAAARREADKARARKGRRLEEVLSQIEHDLSGELGLEVRITRVDVAESLALNADPYVPSHYALAQVTVVDGRDNVAPDFRRGRPTSRHMGMGYVGEMGEFPYAREPIQLTAQVSIHRNALDNNDHHVKVLTKEIADRFRRELERMGRMPAPSPVVASHFIGFREWNLLNGQLAPLSNSSNPWRGSAWVHARCTPGSMSATWTTYDGRRGSKIAPCSNPRHHCGVNVWHTPLHMRHANPPRVIGAVQAKGDCEVHVDGFRAEWARPVALLVPRGSREESWVAAMGIAHVYTVEELVDFALEYGDPIPSEHYPALDPWTEQYNSYLDLGGKLTSGYRSREQQRELLRGQVRTSKQVERLGWI